MLIDKIRAPRAVSMPFVLLLLTLLSALASAEPLRLSSGDARVTLLELYTSEGCSSCPPADDWVSDLRDDPRLWSEVVPVAFHVDYWDYIGWPDRFASASYGRRQRDYAAYGSVRSVYTPGLVVNGGEWRGWFYDKTLRLDPSASSGKLDVEVDTDGGRAVAAFKPADDGAIKRPLTLHLALLGFDLNSEVQAGENRGRELRHDFVVLGYERQRLEPGDLAGGVAYRGALTLPEASQPAARRGLAAWVSSGIDPRPLQAVGGYLPGAD